MPGRSAFAAALLAVTLAGAAPASAQPEENLLTPNQRADPRPGRLAPIDPGAPIAGRWRVNEACVVILSEDGAAVAEGDCPAPWSDARGWRTSRYALQLLDAAGTRLWAGLHTDADRFRGRGAVLTRALD